MFARALLVFLLVMNLGVALWWALRPAGAPAVTAAQADAAPRLQLVSEQRTEAPPPAPPVATQAALPADAVCVSLGPFPDAATAQALVPRLPAAPLRARTSERAAGRVRGWRVLVPPQGSAEAAQAMA